MAAPQFSASDYLGAMQALMPRGRIWSRDAATVQTKVLAGLTASYETQNARANNLLVDGFPKTSNELLPEWEASLGLPSAAAGPAPTLLARQTLVVARFIGAGGISIPCFTQYAALLGFPVAIKGHAPFRCGQSRCGQALGGPEQMYAVTMSTPAATSTPFGAYGPAVLQSEIQRLAPPYSVLKFLFS
jgi:uncharacterized protein YmfQ (DUF2313 family)